MEQTTKEITYITKREMKWLIDFATPFNLKDVDKIEKHITCGGRVWLLIVIFHKAFDFDVTTTPQFNADWWQSLEENKAYKLEDLGVAL